MLEVGPATREEIAAFIETGMETRVARVDGVAIAMATLTCGDKRIWGNLHVVPDPGAHGLAIVRAVRRYLIERGATIHVVCGYPEIPTAQRLLTVLGFTPTEERVADGKQVWRWTP